MPEYPKVDPVATFSRDEVEEAFKHYYLTGPVNEDWVAWANLFTDDAVYHDHFWGTFHGPGEILRWIEATIGGAPQCYTVLDWYTIDPNGVVVYRAINRADNPEPGGPPLDFPSIQTAFYAGNGKWRGEEDWWVMRESKNWGEAYMAAAAKHDPDHASKMTRLDWGHIDWARPVPGHTPNPSWMREGAKIVHRLKDMDFGVRNP